MSPYTLSWTEFIYSDLFMNGFLLVLYSSTFVYVENPLRFLFKWSYIIILSCHLALLPKVLEPFSFMNLVYLQLHFFTNCNFIVSRILCILSTFFSRDGDMASWEEPGEDSTENESGADFPAGNQQRIGKPEIESKHRHMK